MVALAAPAVARAAAPTREARVVFFNDFILFHLLLLTDYFNFSRNRIESRLIAYFAQKKIHCNTFTTKISL
jgi:hypothetical protein